MRDEARQWQFIYVHLSLILKPYYMPGTVLDTSISMMNEIVSAQGAFSLSEEMGKHTVEHRVTYDNTDVFTGH